MKIKLRNPFGRSHPKNEKKSDNENVIEQDTQSVTMIRAAAINPEQNTNTDNKRKKLSFPKIFSTEKKEKKSRVEQKEKKVEVDDGNIPERNAFEKFAFDILSNHLPGFDEFRQSYAQSGIPINFEAYISTGFLLSFVAAVPSFVISLLLEVKLFPRAPVYISAIGSAVLSFVVLGVALVLWLSYPLIKRRSYKSKLENQLAYSFGILGVLAAAGMNLERLFERIATSESNPVLADLAKRFLRNIRVFGLDTETALEEVAQHSPSETFAKMLESIAVAHKTTGSIHDLVMFESARLLQEKRDKLRKTIGSLAVMAELYITLVVVGPIIFIVMLAIFAVLPVGHKLPNPILLINLIVFIGIPVLSVMFVLLLDSVVSKA